MIESQRPPDEEDEDEPRGIETTAGKDGEGKAEITGDKLMSITMMKIRPEILRQNIALITVSDLRILLAGKCYGHRQQIFLVHSAISV